MASKYNVNSDKTLRTYQDKVFDSALEMKYYRDVIMPGIETGEIIKCETQKKFELQPAFIYKGKRVQPITHVIDFYVVYKDGTQKLIDVKGFKQVDARIKRKMFWYQHQDIEYIWVGYSKIDGGWQPVDIIEKGRAHRRAIKKRDLKIKEEKDKKDVKNKRGKQKV